MLMLVLWGGGRCAVVTSCGRRPVESFIRSHARLHPLPGPARVRTSLFGCTRAGGVGEPGREVA